MFAWDDIAVFLALYRERTTSRAAEAVGCSQPTVTRRIAALEHALDLPLFERSATGLKPTAAADQLYPQAEQVERAICGFSSEVAALAGTRAPPAQEFVNKVAISDMFEIQSSQLALSKQADADTKPFAEKMVQDHQKTSSELKRRGRG